MKYGMFALVLVSILCGLLLLERFELKRTIEWQDGALIRYQNELSQCKDETKYLENLTDNRRKR